MIISEDNGLVKLNGKRLDFLPISKIHQLYGRGIMNELFDGHSNLDSLMYKKDMTLHKYVIELLNDSFQQFLKQEFPHKSDNFYKSFKVNVVYMMFMYDCTRFSISKRNIEMDVSPNSVHLYCQLCHFTYPKAYILISPPRKSSDKPCKHLTRLSEDEKRIFDIRNFEKGEMDKEMFSWKLLDFASFLRESVDIRQSYTKHAIYILFCAKRRGETQHPFLNFPKDIFGHILQCVWMYRFTNILN